MVQRDLHHKLVPPYGEKVDLFHSYLPIQFLFLSIIFQIFMMIRLLFHTQPPIFTVSILYSKSLHCQDFRRGFIENTEQMIVVTHNFIGSASVRLAL